jgi:hypothetical protein
MSARNSDPESSQRAADNFSKRASKVQARIEELARFTETVGITQSQVVAAMPEYKPGSITPRFARLVKRGKLVRVYLGTAKPTKRNRTGRPRYLTRLDEETKQYVTLYWIPEFAPKASKCTDTNPTASLNADGPCEVSGNA